MKKIVIIGGGPSGLICAYKCRKNGHDVTLIDKNEKVGKKIYITGKGRCNLTNNCTSEEFFNNVVNNARFLYSSYNNFTSQDTMDFFSNSGVNLITERGNRVFPKSYNAGEIAQTLYEENKKLGVKIYLNEKALDIQKINSSFIVTTSKGQYSADKVVIATGGKSYSHTGSTGDGYAFAKKFNHNIIPPVPGLTALKIKENIPTSLFKFTLKNVSLKINGAKIKHTEFGELTFYKSGIAGPIALTMSSLINRIEANNLKMSIDFKPALTSEQLDARIIREIQNKANKTVLDLLHKLLPSEIIPWFLYISKIDEKENLISLKKENRQQILNQLKDFKLTYLGLDDIDHAIITSGGIDVKEINPKTMESKLVPGLFFAGEVIDVDAFTGGFNMQIAFTTGVAASQDL